MQRRLALTNSLIIVLAAVVVGLVLMPLRTAATQAAIDDQLVQTGQALTQSANLQTPSVDIFSARPVFVQAEAQDGTVIGRSANLGAAELPHDPADLLRARTAQALFVSFVLQGHPLRGYELPLPQPASTSTSTGATSPVLLQVASPLDEDLPRGPILFGLLAGLLIGVGTAVVVGWLLARIALSPIERLAATVDSIGSTADLSRRVPVVAKSNMQPDAVQRLGLRFNAMLERLEVATVQLENALEAQRQFVADASHELRTPLTSLRGNVSLLSRMCAEDCPLPTVAQHQEILADLDGEAERMTRLITSLLWLAQADAQQHLSLTLIDLEPVLQSAYRTARVLSEQVTVQLGDVPANVEVLADPDRLAQLLLILLDNAVRYTPADGKVDLRAILETRQDRPGVRIEVADNGPGIPPSERDHIFERFYRGRGARRIEGAGLGLAVAHWIAEEHAADMNVVDNTPTGTVFQLWLPVSEPV